MEFKCLDQADVDMLYYKMRVIFALFDKYNIKSSMWAGTLLGSLRHKGLIPWDDDADIIIDQAQEGILAMVERDLPHGLYFGKYQCSPTQKFYKIKHISTFAHRVDKGKQLGHHDVDIDIFMGSRQGN